VRMLAIRAPILLLAFGRGQPRPRELPGRACACARRGFAMPSVFLTHGLMMRRSIAPTTADCGVRACAFAPVGAHGLTAPHAQAAASYRLLQHLIHNSRCMHRMQVTTGLLDSSLQGAGQPRRQDGETDSYRVLSTQ
jgi:hypothetical protein